MGREIVETCDVCGRVVSDVMSEGDGIHSEGRGYIKAKKITWTFGPWPKFWHRVDLGFDIVCDYCLLEIKQRVRERLEMVKGE